MFLTPSYRRNARTMTLEQIIAMRGGGSATLPAQSESLPLVEPQHDAAVVSQVPAIPHHSSLEPEGACVTVVCAQELIRSVYSSQPPLSRTNIALLWRRARYLAYTAQKVIRGDTPNHTSSLHVHALSAITSTVLIVCRITDH